MRLRCPLPNRAKITDESKDSFLPTIEQTPLSYRSSISTSGKGVPGWKGITLYLHTVLILAI